MTNGQKQYRIHGTVVIAAVGSDGILIAADSRAVQLEYGTNKPLMYKDSVEKILVVNGLPVGFCGDETYNGKSIRDVINDYMKSPETSLDPRDKLESFQEYINKLYPYSTFYSLKFNTMFSGSYIDKKPVIIVATNQQGVFFKSDSYYTSNTECNRLFAKIYKPGLKCSLLKSTMEKFIKNYYHSHTLNLYIGGPISFVKISVDNSFKYLPPDLSKKTDGESQWHPIQNRISGPK